MAYENILAQIASPKPSNYLASYMGGVEARSALDEQQRQGQARQLAGRALTGDKAAGQQLAQVDPQVFMELRKFQGDERAKELERVGGLYYSADTPEKWSVAMNFLKKAGYEVSPEDEDFRNRDALLGMAMTAAQRIAMEHQNRQFGLQEREFAANQDYRAQSLDLERQRLAQTAGKDSLLAKMQERATAAQTMGLDPKSAEFRNFVLTGAQSSLGRGNASLTATDRKAILEADDTVLANEGVISALDRAITINNKAYSGIGASVRPILDRNLPDFIPGINEAKGTATTEFQNLVLGQALASLKSTFGAAPTEGERQILLDLQASVDKSPAERKLILERAKVLAQRRLDMNRERASQLRSGTFYQPQDSRTQPPSDTPDEGPAAQNGLEPGALYEYQGGNWRYRGGDPADPQSWEQE